MKFFMTFSYDGSKYNGYQKQPKLKTIQSELEKVVKKINSNKKVSVVASGRTDAGVHAYGQAAHFNLNIDICASKLKKSLNSLLPQDIYVKTLKEIDDDFHARFSVKAKEYIYKINMGDYNPIEKDYVFQYNKNLNIEDMKKALNFLEGTHDFRSFVKIDEEKEDYVRTIIRTSVTVNNDLVIISIMGTGFMRYMVRNIVGTLIEIGEGKYKSSEIISILESKDRKKAGKCAPACGLYLKDVYY